MENKNATQLLRDDHKRIRGLFRQFEAVDVRAHEMKSGVVREIFMELEIHSRLEQELFYPAFQSAAGELSTVLVGKALDEHKVVQGIIDELRARGVDESGFDSRFAELIEEVQLHIDEEEKEMLRDAEMSMPGQLQELGARMSRRRSELLQQPEYRDARPGVVQNPNGGEQIRKSA